jgi:hypothetical protein
MIQIHYYLIRPNKTKVRKLKVEVTQGEASAKAKFEKWFKKMFPKSKYEIIEIY